MQVLLALALLASIEATDANRAFAELHAMCVADAGRLWGRSICGPIVFADPRTREAMTEDGPSSIPDSIGIANTAVEWNGKTWTMVMWPLPESVIARRALLAHESFHRLQKDLGLPNANPSNAHLDGADARYWMRLEWRALARALATGEKSAVADALAFRAKRRAAGGGEDERLLEINEGLAEYTGYRLAVPQLAERVPALVRRLANAEKSEAFARSFAYTSGIAWGSVIEMRDRNWTRKVKASDDLGAIAKRLWQIGEPAAHPERYDGDAVRADEDQRFEKKKAMFARFKVKFIDGPLVVIPLGQFQFTFDPTRVQPFGNAGTVYPVMEVRDVWGKIVVTDGALMSPDYKWLTVPASGEGYELTLAEGWQVKDGRVVKR